MTEKLQKAAESVTGVEGKIVELIDSIQAGVTKYSPQAAELAFQAVKVEALGNLLCLGIIFLLSMIAVISFRFIARSACEKENEKRRLHEEQEDKRAAEAKERGNKYHYKSPFYPNESEQRTAVVISMCCLIPAILSFLFLTQPLDWIALLHPEVKIAYDIYQSIKH